jgi:cardiolipin synthase A/B
MDRSTLLRLAVLVLASCAHNGGGEDVTPDASPSVEPDAPDNQLVGDFCNATDPRPMPVEMVATPEAGEAPYNNALDAAQSSIDVQVYLMGYGGILDRLKSKAAAGVKVRVILDQYRKDTNQKYFDQLTAAGVEVKWSSPSFTYQHSKFLLIDGKAAVISTGNFSKSYSIELERNFVATDRDPHDLADMKTLFEADWNGTALQMPCTRLVVSPINARERILDIINSAQSTLLIESMQFADTDVRAAVKARVLAGVDVRVLLADASWIDANASAATFLKDLGVTVKWIPHLHTKVIIADGTSAYMGSENLSWTSLDKNREVGVVVSESSSIAPLSATFEGDWTAGTAF